MESPTGPKDMDRHYARGVRRLRLREKALRSRKNRIALFRMASFLLTVALPLSVYLFHSPSPRNPFIYLALLPGGLLFLWLVRLHMRVSLELELLRSQSGEYDESLVRFRPGWQGRLEVRTPSLDTQEHPYAGDLDLFGRFSLFQYLDRTSLPGGREELARLLATQPADEALSAPLWESRRRDLRDLSRKPVFRQRFRREGGRLRREEPHAFELPWLKELQRPLERVPGPLLLSTARTLPPLTLLSLFLFSAADLPPYFLLTLPVQFLLFLYTHVRFRGTARSCAETGFRLSLYENLFRTASRAPSSLPSVLRLREEAPHLEMSRIARIGGLYMIRTNPLVHFPLGLFFLYEVHLLHGLRRWIEKNGSRVEEWFRSLFRLDAELALSEYIFDHPGSVDPELMTSATEGEESLFLEAEELGHPLLPEESRVNNSFRFGGRENVWIITGSNMSGKSTFLRTVGMGLLLAMAGLPVPARKFRFRSARLHTSMRHTDDTEHSVSFFYAEVRRIKGILEESARKDPPLFYLIDEMLRGTNTRERLIASRSILEDLSNSGAVGMVSTHDVELTALCTERKEMECLHFEEIIREGKMSFDYRLKQGPVHSSNALRILENEGIPIRRPPSE